MPSSILHEIPADAGSIEDLALQVRGFTGHRLSVLLNDQLAILRRLHEDDASDAEISSPLHAFNTEVTAAEQAQLRRYLSEWIGIIDGNGVAGSLSTVLLNVREFGAKGDGSANDQASFERALAALKNAPAGAVLKIPAGRYRLGTADARAHLRVEGLKDLSIVGEPGTELIGSDGDAAVLWIANCRNVRLCHIGVDYDPLPFTQGVITEIDADRRSLVWRPDAGYPAPDTTPFSDAERIGGCVLQGSDNRLPAHAHGMFTAHRREPLGDGRWRLYSAASAPIRADIHLGDRLVLFLRRSTRHAVVISNCEWLDLEDVNVYGAYGFAVLIESSTGVSFRHCHLEPRAGRLGGLNADGFHARSNRYGPFFESCRIRRVMDDCFNLYSRAVSVDDVISERELVLDLPWEASERLFHWQPGRTDFRVDDILIFLNPLNGEPAGHAKIESIVPHNWRGHERVAVRLDRPISGLLSRDMLGRHKPVMAGAEFLAPDIPTPIEHFAINVSTKSDGFVIRDCDLGDNTVTGGKVKAGNGLITANRHARHGWCCWSLSSEMVWQEGFAARRVRIEGNDFDNWFGIYIGAYYPLAKHPVGPAYGYRIDISNNVFRNVIGKELCIDINSVAGCTVAGNTLSADRPIAVGPSASGLRIGGNRCADACGKIN